MNKILIIDDDRELCALIKRSVQAENIEADFCNTGKDGLQKLKEQEYQLVVLDVMMPGMDGFETLEEIRKENSLPILMFTSIALKAMTALDFCDLVLSQPRILWRSPRTFLSTRAFWKSWVRT